jgi:hypothetical protein
VSPLRQFPVTLSRPRSKHIWRRFALAAVLLAHSPLLAKPSPVPRIGLFSSLPIVLPEADDVRSLLRSPAPRHWALATLSARGELVPLDTLVRLKGLNLLVMAQPRALSPQENMALDRWVRRGGRLLLFADPLLTQESTFGLGDRRAPQAVALLSPILSHWGLDLQFDDEQPIGEHVIDAFGGSFPVNLPGAFALGNSPRICQIPADGAGLIAQCRIGKGRVLAIADAALFEDEKLELRSAALARALAELEK